MLNFCEKIKFYFSKRNLSQHFYISNKKIYFSMKKFLLSLSLFLIFCVNSYSQDSLSHKKNIVYLELFGNGGFYSVNYERMLTNSQKGYLALRLGGGYCPNFSEAVISELNLATKTSEKGFFNFGFGVSYMGVFSFKSGLSDGDYSSWSESYWFRGIFFTQRISYRRHYSKKGFLQFGILGMLTLHKWKYEWVSPKKLIVADQPRFFIYPSISVGFNF